MAIIIKHKLISIAKSVFSRRLSVLFLAVYSSFLFVSSAQAAESPIQSLVDFSKEKLTKAKEVTIENPLLAEQTQVDPAPVQDNAKSQAVPSAVSDTTEVEKAVDFASNATGVRKDFLMGMLVVESNLGRNPGKCTYQEVEQGAELSHQNGQLSSTSWETFKHRRDIMKTVANSLGYDYEQLKVSCNPGAAYAGTGGAMGIPQFMPDIWMSYKDRVATIVGKDNPDPWNAKDGAVAMALLVSDTPGVTDHSLFAERNAAKMYLSGTTSSKYEWYANQILYWSQNYSKLTA